MAKEKLFFLGMAIFDNMCVPAMRICRPVRQLLISWNDTQDKTNDSFDVRFTKEFDAAEQGCNFIFHWLSPRITLDNHILQLFESQKRTQTENNTVID